MALSDKVQGSIAKATQLGGIANALTGGGLFSSNKGKPANANRKDVTNFISTLNKLKGLQKTSHFYVEINLPQKFKAWAPFAEYFSFLTESAALPGVSLASTDIRRYGYGPTEKKPYAPIFVDTTLTFFVDQQGIIQRFFYYWMNNIVKFNTLHNGGATKNVPTKAGMAPFEVGFKDDYATDIIITMLSETGDKVTQFKLYDAYPVFMGDISVSWVDSDNLARLPITFTYYNYEISNYDGAANLADAKVAKPKADLLSTLQKTASAVQVLSNIRKPNGVADIVNTVGNAKIAIGGLF